MAIKKVTLYTSQLLKDLNEGLSWFKSEDYGYGSIQEKYGANDKQILDIKSHKLLEKAEPNITIFTIVDDKNETIKSSDKVLTSPSTNNVESLDKNNIVKTNIVSENMEAFNQI